MKRNWMIFGLIVSLSVTAWAKKPRVGAKDFKNQDNPIATLWSVIPFFAEGDIAQYEQTIAQDRDSVRRDFWNDFMGGMTSLAQQGADVERMAEPLFNILMLFDQTHEAQKSRDVIKVDKSMEAYFMAALDQDFRNFDLRDTDRKIQFAGGTAQALLNSAISNPASKRALYDQVDYVAYGTFSHLGSAKFQVTLHLQGVKTGVVRSFMAYGFLMEAMDSLARQVFDFFQKNVHPDWQPATTTLQWLPAPQTGNHGDVGYTFNEAHQYCLSRGYRLPYSRELEDAETGSDYRGGGISLDRRWWYAIADRRRVNDHYFWAPELEDRTGGATQPDPGSHQGLFWCVKGPVAPEIKFLDKLWELHREYFGVNKDVYAAIETLRFELGDSDTDLPYWGQDFDTFKRLSGVNEALGVLRVHNVSLDLPPSLQ